MNTRYKIIGDIIEPIRETTSPALGMFCSGRKEKPIDWEQRRYETAKAAMQGFCANSVPSIAQGTSFQQITEWCIEIADILIAELKKGGQQ